MTASGVIRPPWSTGRGYRSTRLFPLSATYSVPSGATAIPAGAYNEVDVAFAEPGESTFAAPVRMFGWPITRSAGSPLRNRTESFQTRTRLLFVSETYSANGGEE